MRLIESLKKRKFVLLNVILTLYIGVNLIGGERGIFSYFEKKNIYKVLTDEENKLSLKLNELEHKISLVKNNDPDYLDMLYREKFKFGTKEEVIIKLK